MAINKFCSMRLFRYIMSVAIPLALIPIAAIGTKEAKCSYVMVLMAAFWMLELLPLPVTSLFPVVFFPLFDIMSTGDSSMPYMSATNMVFVSGLTIAIAIEHCNLHTRIALKVLLTLGTSLKRLLLGFMLSTAFLSMWISNTATAAMMVPILDAVLTEIEKFAPVKEDEDDQRDFPMMKISDNDQELETTVLGKRMSFTLTDETENNRPPVKEKMSFLKKGLFLSVAYAANIGGIGTLIGTGPNLVLQGTLSKKFPDSTEITFASWMLYAIPGMLVCLALAWVVLLMFMRRSGVPDSKEGRKNIRELLQNKFDELGPLNFHQCAVIVLFTLFILVLFFRDPRFFPGWGPAIAKVKIHDATAAMAVALLLFFIPSRPLELSTSPALLDWKTVQQKMPWGIILLLGGGFSMAAGFEKSGLSEWVKSQLEGMRSLSAPALLVILSLLTAGLTELTSNVTTASAFLPVVADLAIVLRVHPLYLMLPVAVSCSFAFMLPIATPPNAIVYEAAHMSTKDMAIPGLIMNLLCCGVSIASVLTLGQALFSLNSLPDWANEHLVGNSTISHLFHSNTTF